MKNMQCPVCKEDIVVCYKTPTQTFIIENGEFKRDDAWKGPEYDNPYLKFYCSADMEHNIETEEIIKWSEEVNSEFYFALPHL